MHPFLSLALIALLPLPAAPELAPVSLPPAPSTPPEIHFPAPTAPGAIVDATKAYSRGGKAAVLRETNVEIHPYGHSTPVVRCPLLSICDVELQPGETVLATAVGDTLRWQVALMNSGPPEARSPHVILKAQDYDLATNMIVTTDRRTYNLVLLSPSQTAAESSDFRMVQRLRFYYPDDLVQHFSKEAAAATAAAERRAANTVATLASDPTTWHFEYRVTPAKAPGAPLLVLDDGTRTFVQLSPNRARGETPALVVLDEEGQSRIVNYRVSPDSNWLIVDGVFERSQLVHGSGRSKRSIAITKVNRR
jgi:P-type conjugative transfer protein TrbG